MPLKKQRRGCCSLNLAGLKKRKRMSKKPYGKNLEFYKIHENVDDSFIEQLLKYWLKKKISVTSVVGTNASKIFSIRDNCAK